MRLFTAIPVPASIAKTIERFTGGFDDVRWVDPVDYHLTLTFHESVSQDELFGLENILAMIDFTPFELELNGLGVFPSESGTTLWAAVKESSALFELQDQIQSQLSFEGFGSARKKFTPHITIGKTKTISPTDLQGFLQQGIYCTGSPFTVEFFSIFQSELSSTGAIYSELSRFGDTVDE